MPVSKRFSETRKSHCFLELEWGVDFPNTDIATHLESAGIEQGYALWTIDRIEVDPKLNRFGDQTGTVWFTLHLTPSDAAKWDANVAG
jgi:hypothetical protein